jgi:cysteine desulfurase
MIRAQESGTIDLDHLATLLQSAAGPPKLVSVMQANHETGVLQPLREVVTLCASRGVPVHTDAVQAVGKIPLDFQQLGVAFMTVTAHKLHGPVGIGALVVRGTTPLQPILFGGSQQLGTRPGTEPVALAVGMQVALRRAQEHLLQRTSHLASCRDELQRRLTATTEMEVEVNGTAPRLPHVLNVSFSRIDRQALLMALDLAGIHCSSGSACASGSSEPSHVLRAMGLPDARILSALRLSVGATSRDEEMLLASERILRAAKQLRA